MKNITKEEKKKFWSKVDKTSGCWEWVGSKLNIRQSYGRVTIQNKSLLTHRVSYMFRYGDIPKGMCVCHSCDNPKCVRPSHLFLGTQRDNITDRCRKGRSSTVRGKDSPLSKLTENQVRRIRELYFTGKYTHRALSEKYRIGKTQVARIIKRERWRHVN